MSAIVRRRRENSDPYADAPPGRGENIRRDIPNDERGIHFELGKMAQYVGHFSGDPLVLRTSRKIISQCKAKDKTCEMAALFGWTKSRFRYVNDPPSREVIATPIQQLNDIMEPPAILEALLGPDLTRQISGFGIGDGEPIFSVGHQIYTASCFRGELSGLKPKASGDCDEAATLLAAMLAASGINARFRLGGTASPNRDCDYHHVWVQGLNEAGEWIDMDITEERSKLGWFFEGFSCTGYVNIPGVTK